MKGGTSYKRLFSVKWRKFEIGERQVRSSDKSFLVCLSFVMAVLQAPHSHSEAQRVAAGISEKTRWSYHRV